MYEGPRKHLDNQDGIQNRLVTPTTPYNFRLLTGNDLTAFLTEAQGANAAVLTSTFLRDDRFRPTGVLDVDGIEFYAGKVVKRHSRDQAIMFVKSRNGKIVPRVFYKSMSDGGWRSCPGARWSNSKKDFLYSKGNRVHYTQETKPHADISRYLDDCSEIGHLTTYSGDIIDDYFVIEDQQGKRPDAREWYTFPQESRRYNDKGALEQFQRFPPGTYEDTRYRGVNIAKALSSFDYSGRLDGFVPDFSLAPTHVIRAPHTLLGYTTIESYPGVLNDREVEWQIAYDNEGRVWIDRIHFTRRDTNTYGTASEIIDSGVLTNKPLEYNSHVSRLVKGKDYTDALFQYVDITPLLDNLYPIQAFRHARHIEEGRIPNSFYGRRNFSSPLGLLKQGQRDVPANRKIRLDEATGFRELYGMLNRLQGLQGSNQFYSARELCEIIDQVRRGKLAVETITRTNGLRAKVIELLD